MQFLKIASTLTLPELSNMVGRRNVDSVLTLNGLSRAYDIGKKYAEKCTSVVEQVNPVDWQKKAAMLNKHTRTADVFEYAALQGESSWKVFANTNSFPGMLQMPEDISLPSQVNILGNDSAISKRTYQQVMNQVMTAPHMIDPGIFNDVSTSKPSAILNASGSTENANVFQQFMIPWGDITLWSSLDNDSVNIPVYPETIEDGVSATYAQMPELLYQYEPWQVYQSSGPRTCTYEFHVHRDMWTGDHRDGKCNQLIRFLQSQCYPKYSGSLVDTSIVKLYVKGNVLISGIMQDVKDSWAGPIGLDGWYLECTITVTITEVAESLINHDTQLQKPVIG